MAFARTNGEILEQFSKMRIKHPRLKDAHELFDDLRHAKRAAPGRPQKFGALFAPSQSGKSMSVQTYIETRVVDDAIERGLFPAETDRLEIARLQKIVVHVTLSAKSTPKSLAIDILNAFGDPAGTRGTAQSLLKRAYDYMRHFGTELLVIDEVQHLDDRLVQVKEEVWGGRSGVAHSTSVTDTLKTFLLHGLVPLVFVGLAEARHHVFNDVQLAARCHRELKFGTLDFGDPDQRTIFRDYVGRLGLKLRAHSLFEEETDLVSGDIPALLHEVAGGRLGMATNVVLAAAVVAREAGDKCVTREHLATAVDDWAIPLRLIDYNPFRTGLRTLQLKEAA